MEDRSQTPLAAPGLTAPPVPERRPTTNFTKIIVNMAVSATWLGLLILPGVFVNVYVIAGVDFDDETVARTWAIAAFVTIYGGVVISATLAHILIVTKDVGWKVLVALWLFSPIGQVVWLYASQWAGETYGWIV